MKAKDQNVIEELEEDVVEGEVEETVESHFEGSASFPCASCGGPMAFDPESSQLKCNYCGSEQAIEVEKGDIVEQCFKTALRAGVRGWEEDDITSFSCTTCGAEMIFDPHTQAQSCNYCGSSHITQKKAENTIPPHYLVPFSVTEKGAGQSFQQWIAKRWLAPNDLKKAYKQNRLMGTYVPHWTYDANTYSYYTAQRGDYYYVTRTRTVNGKQETYQERRIRWRHVRGDHSRFFDDVLTTASDKVDGTMLEKVKPFHLEALAPYKPEYLSGFFAERYSVSLERGWESGKWAIDNAIESDIHRKIGGDRVRFLEVKTAYNDVTFKHILLPIWLSNFTYQSKVYHFMVNGQTGETVGDYPKSPVKIALLVFAAIVLVLAVIYALNSGAV